MNTQDTHKLLHWGWIVLVILAVFLGVNTLKALKGLREVPPAYNSITVSGEGEAFAIPDLATFSFTVSADEKTVSEAQAEATAKMDRVLTAVKALGIEDKDVKTSDYSVYPRYSYTQPVCTQFSCPPGRQQLDGYTASHSVTVKVRKTEDAGKVLSAAGENGATNLSSLSFTVDDPDAITSEARAMAIAEAKEKAETLAKELGVRLVKVVSFSDSLDGGYPMPYGRAEMGMGGIAVAQDAKAPTLPTGENKVRIVVHIVYEIR